MNFSISNKEIPGNKNISISLTYLYGIGRNVALEIVKKCNIDPFIKTKNLDDSQFKAIVQTINKDYTIEEKLKEEVRKAIDIRVKIGTYHGLRLMKKLPIRGQRTRHNAQTAKGKDRKKKVVANKKKAPSPK